MLIEFESFNKHEFSTNSVPYYAAGVLAYPENEMYPMMDPAVNPYFAYPPYGFGKFITK